MLPISATTIGKLAPTLVPTKSKILPSKGVEVDFESPLRQGGDIFTVPRFQKMGAWQRPVANSDLTPETASGVEEKAPVVRRANVLKVIKNQIDGWIKNGGDLNAHIADLIALNIGENMDKLIARLSGVSPLVYTKTYQGSYQVKFEDVAATKALFGDTSEESAVVILSTKAFYDLLAENKVDPYKVPSTNAIGMLATILGAEVIVSDALPLTDKTEAIFIKEKGIYLAMQNEFDTSESYDARSGHFFRYDAAFAPCIRGLSWGGGVNPSDNDLFNASNWTVVAPENKLISIARLRYATQQ